MSTRVRNKRKFRNDRLVTVRCSACSKRVGLLFTVPTAYRGWHGRTWYGSGVGKKVEIPSTPAELLTRKHESGYHNPQRQFCGRCGRPWPNDDTVTAVVRQAELTGARSATLP